MKTERFTVSRKQGKATSTEAYVSYQGVSEVLGHAPSGIKPDIDPKLLAREVTGVHAGGRTEMLAKIKRGLAFHSIERLEHALQSSRKEIASVLSIPSSTMTRRKKEGILHVDESDRVVRVAQLFDSAMAMMQSNRNAAIAWLRTPLEILDGESPLERSATEMGARDVEDLIGRIRHGVFS